MVPPRNRLHPSFALFCAFLAIDVGLLLFLPYFCTRFADSPWNTAARAGFLGKAIASGLAFGLVASISAERRNRSPWWFVAGHLGVLVAAALALADVDRSNPLAATLATVAAGFVGAIAALILASRPAEEAPKADPVLDGAARLMHAVSDIRFGIVLMALVAIAVQYGSVHESMYNAKSAHATVYRSWWFASAWFVAGLSMLAATFRKWPWRLEQSGWLTVHSGLALVVIGSMISFFSTVEGEMALREGESSSRIRLHNAARLTVEEVGFKEDGRRFRRTLADEPTSFDFDPRKTDARQTLTVPIGDGAKAVRVEVDLHYSSALPFETWTDDGTESRAGIELDFRIKGGAAPPRVIRLDERQAREESLQIGGPAFDLQFTRLPEPTWAALLRTEDSKDYGRLVLRDLSGAAVLEMPVAPASRPAGVDDGKPADLVGVGAIGDVEVALVAYADQIGKFPGRPETFDLSPGRPQDPAVVFTLKKDGAEETRVARAFRPETDAAATAAVKDTPFPYMASYEFAPRLPLDGPLLVFGPTADDEGLRFIYQGAQGAPVSGLVQVGTPLPLPMPRLEFVATKIFRRARVETGWKFDGFKDGGRPAVARVDVSGGDVPAKTIWLRRDGRPEVFEAFDRAFAVSWRADERPLGFSLKLNEFLREFYPGSRSEKTFESYLELTHPTKFPTATDVKIDMNRPLRLDGWRLFQARFGQDDATTFLQVNRDPGLSLIYPACCIVLLGIVVVSFLKRPLRERRLTLERRGANSVRHIVEGATAVAAVGAGPVLFGLWAASGLPSSGILSFTVGIVLVALAPAAVVLGYVRALPALPPLGVTKLESP